MRISSLATKFAALAVVIAPAAAQNPGGPSKPAQEQGSSKPILFKIAEPDGVEKDSCRMNVILVDGRASRVVGFATVYTADGGKAPNTHKAGDVVFVPFAVGKEEPMPDPIERGKDGKKSTTESGFAKRCADLQIQKFGK